MYWTQGHFLTEVRICRYKDKDLSQEEWYLKSQLMAFYYELCYIGEMVPFDYASKKRLKR